MEAYLKYAKNPEEVPTKKNFFRIFLYIEQGAAQSSNLMILRQPLSYREELL